MKNITNIFIDTGVLSQIAWTSNLEQIPEIKRKWDFVISQIDKYYPNFSITDFYSPFSPSLFMELIGLGQIKNKKNKLKNTEFKNEIPLRTIIENIDWKKFIGQEKKYIQIISTLLLSKLKKILPADKIHRQANNFCKKYRSHKNSDLFMNKLIKEIAESIKNDQSTYEYLIKNLTNDCIYRFPYAENFLKEDQKLYKQFWATIKAHLLNSFFSDYKKDESVNTSPLGIVADNNMRFNNGTKLLRIWDDMADTDSIKFALMGCKENNKPVIVITADSPEDIKKRLECLYTELKYANDLYKKNNQPDRIIQFFNPGIIFCFNGKTLELKKLINVESFCNKIKFNRIVPEYVN